MVKLLLPHSRMQLPYQNEWTPPLFALINGHLEITRLLLSQGAQPSTYHDFPHYTPLLAAAKAQYWEIVKLLVENNADTTRVNAKEETILILAAKAGKKEIVQLLLEKQSHTGINVALS
jgi:ankyrin repeat protein